MQLQRLFSKRGFTLIELLVVITIIIILAAVVMIAINPAEMARRGRDATRLSDIENVRKAIDLGMAEFSIEPDDLAAGPLSSCTASARGCNDGSNWIGGVDVCAYLAIMPLDPTNSGSYCYHYAGVPTAGDPNQGTYEINCVLESPTNADRMKTENDGGDNDSRYEVGTFPGLTLLH